MRVRIVGIVPTIVNLLVGAVGMYLGKEAVEVLLQLGVAQLKHCCHRHWRLIGIHIVHQCGMFAIY